MPSVTSRKVARAVCLADTERRPDITEVAKGELDRRFGGYLSIGAKVLVQTRRRKKKLIRDLRNEVFCCRLCKTNNEAFAVHFNKSPFGNRLSTNFRQPSARPVKRMFCLLAPTPRRTGNLDIHEFAMTSKSKFRKLSHNINHLQNPYITENSYPDDPHEPHYDPHLEILKRTFAQPVEKVAAVTDICLCATVNADGLDASTSPCAKQYLMRTISQVQPEFIVTFGAKIPGYFSNTEARVKLGANTHVIHLPHPSGRNMQVPREQMRKAVDWAVAATNAVRGRTQLPTKDWSWGANDKKMPQSVCYY